MHRQVYIFIIIHTYIAIEAVKGMEITLNITTHFPI